MFTAKIKVIDAYSGAEYTYTGGTARGKTKERAVLLAISRTQNDWGCPLRAVIDSVCYDIIEYDTDNGYVKLQEHPWPRYDLAYDEAL